METGIECCRMLENLGLFAAAVKLELVCLGRNSSSLPHATSLHNINTSLSPHFNMPPFVAPFGIAIVVQVVQIRLLVYDGTITSENIRPRVPLAEGYHFVDVDMPLGFPDHFPIDKQRALKEALVVAIQKAIADFTSGSLSIWFPRSFEETDVGTDLATVVVERVLYEQDPEDRTSVQFKVGGGGVYSKKADAEVFDSDWPDDQD